MNSASDKLRQALDLYHDGDFTRAEMLLETLDFEALEPDLHVEAWYLWGLVLRKKGDPLESANRFQKCVRLDPRFFPALDAWGNVLASIGDSRGAIEKYKRAIAVSEPRQSSHVLFNYGQVLLRNGYSLRALRKFRESFKRNPDNAGAAYMTGLSFIKLNRPQGARKWMTTALELEPENPRNLVGVGNAELADGHVKQAIEHYRRALEIDPKCSDAHYNWAVALGHREDYGGAVKHCKLGLQIHRHGFELLAQQTYCLRKMGAYDAALQSVKRMRQIIDNAENAERKQEFLDVLAANEAGCLRAVNRNQQARQTLVAHLREAYTSCPHSLRELRYLDVRRIHEARKIELTINVRRSGTTYGLEPVRPLRYNRTYWVIANDLKDARQQARELEPQDAQLRFEPDVVTVERYPEADRGVIERSPAIPED